MKKVASRLQSWPLVAMGRKRRRKIFVPNDDDLLEQPKSSSRDEDEQQIESATGGRDEFALSPIPVLHA